MGNAIRTWEMRFAHGNAIRTWECDSRDKDGSFSDVTEAAGLARAGDGTTAWLLRSETLTMMGFRTCPLRVMEKTSFITTMGTVGDGTFTDVSEASLRVSLPKKVAP
jgi:hypothetical protein